MRRSKEGDKPIAIDLRFACPPLSASYLGVQISASFLVMGIRVFIGKNGNLLFVDSASFAQYGAARLKLSRNYKRLRF